MRRKIIETLLIGFVIGSILTGCSDLSEAEKSRELADLQGMRGAELTAMLVWQDKLPDDTIEYWYDPDTFELTPVTGLSPAPSGLGTASIGGATQEFRTEKGNHLDYEENVDYTDKAIHVTVTNEEGKLHVKVNWVSVK